MSSTEVKSKGRKKADHGYPGTLLPLSSSASTQIMDTPRPYSLSLPVRQRTKDLHCTEAEAYVFPPCHKSFVYTRVSKTYPRWRCLGKR